VEGFSGHRSGWQRAALIGVGALLIVISIAVMVSPAFGAAFAGILIAIALMITGFQMIAAGATGERFRSPISDIGR
jgi:uncharacterized membrane protein HdeD (DUF308 family)